jgi:hypothetical protein
VKNSLDRHPERGKSDEDIAERISGGVRLERSSPLRKPEVAHDQPPSPAKDSHAKRRRRTR